MASETHLIGETLTMLIPIVAIIMGVGLAMLSIYMDFRRKREILNAIHRERLAAIDKGMELPPLPPEIFKSQDRGPPRSPARTLERGLLLIFIGIAIAVALWRTGNDAAWWGLVPFGMGLAYLISSRFRAAEQSRPASSPGNATDDSSQ